MIKPKNQIKQRDKIILVNVLFAVVFFAIYYFFIQAGLNDLSAINQSINDDFNALKILEKKGRDVKKLKQSLTSANAMVDKLSEYFITDELAFVTSIEDSASDLGLTERLVMGDAKITGKIKLVPITLYTQGSFKQQLELIKKFSGMNYFFNIKSIDFAKVVSKEPADVKIDMVLNVDTYWQIK